MGSAKYLSKDEDTGEKQKSAVKEYSQVKLAFATYNLFKWLEKNEIVQVIEERKDDKWIWLKYGIETRWVHQFSRKLGNELKESIYKVLIYPIKVEGIINTSEKLMEMVPSLMIKRGQFYADMLNSHPDIMLRKMPVGSETGLYVLTSLLVNTGNIIDAADMEPNGKYAELLYRYFQNGSGAMDCEESIDLLGIFLEKVRYEYLRMHKYFKDFRKLYCSNQVQDYMIRHASIMDEMITYVVDGYAVVTQRLMYAVLHIAILCKQGSVVYVGNAKDLINSFLIGSDMNHDLSFNDLKYLIALIDKGVSKNEELLLEILIRKPSVLFAILNDSEVWAEVQARYRGKDLYGELRAIIHVVAKYMVQVYVHSRLLFLGQHLRLFTDVNTLRELKFPYVYYASVMFGAFRYDTELLSEIANCRLSNKKQADIRRLYAAVKQKHKFAMPLGEAMEILVSDDVNKQLQQNGK